MAQFAAVILTAPPPGSAGEAGGHLSKIDGRETLLRSAELFLNRDQIIQIQMVISQDSAEEIKRKVGVNLGFLGIKLTTCQGKRWNEQLSAAIARLDPACTHVIVHDASRPLVPYNDIDALMEAGLTHPAVVLTCPLRSNLVEWDETKSPISIKAANEFVCLLYPHIYARRRFETMVTQPIHASELKLISGSPLNIRLAGAADERLAKAFLVLMPKPKMKAPSNPFDEAQW